MPETLSHKICELCGLAYKKNDKTINFEEPENFYKLFNLTFLIDLNDTGKVQECTLPSIVYSCTVKYTTSFLEAVIKHLEGCYYSYSYVSSNLKQVIRNNDWIYTKMREKENTNGMYIN